MRFKLDENLPVEAGYDAATVAEQGLSGEPDPAIAAVCRVEARVLVTLDTDFADLRTYPPEDQAGLIVLRLQQQDRPHVVQVIRRLLPLLVTEPLGGHPWIVDENRIRIRGAGRPS